MYIFVLESKNKTTIGFQRVLEIRYCNKIELLEALLSLIEIFKIRVNVFYLLSLPDTGENEYLKNGLLTSFVTTCLFFELSSTFFIFNCFLF